MEYGMIEVMQHVNGFGDRTLSYKLFGDVFNIERRYLPKGLTTSRRFSLGGVSLIVVKEDQLSGMVTVVRDTKWLYVAWYLVFDPFVNWLQMVYGRILLTMAVWNLAKRTEGEIPSLRWVTRRWFER